MRQATERQAVEPANEFGGQAPVSPAQPAAEQKAAGLTASFGAGPTITPKFPEDGENNSEFNILNANLVVPVRCQFTLGEQLEEYAVW
jgi:hypothetical protein